MNDPKEPWKWDDEADRRKQRESEEEEPEE